MKKIVYSCTVGLSLLIAVLAFNYFSATNYQQVKVNEIKFDLDEAAIATKLAQAIQIKTISMQGDSGGKKEDFKKFHEFLAKVYPHVFKMISHEVINGYSLLFHWQGSSANEQPVLLMGHFDVVPVNTGNWQYPPFAGVVDDTHVWGRGALDDKCSIIALLSSVEKLLANGFQPKTSIYLFFGHDEEIGGKAGAMAATQLLVERKVKLAAVIDEGGIISRGLMPGIKKDVALIGIAEKGYLDLELSAAAAGGHSSLPPEWTASGRVARAVARLEENKLPAKIDGAVGLMFQYMASESAFLNRLAFTNLWLFSGMIKSTLAKKESGNAILRTTTAPTMLSGSKKENVLPTQATAVVNFRILPGDTIAQIKDRVKQIIADDEITIKELPFSSEPGSVSSTVSPIFKKLHSSFRSAFPDVLVSPYLVVGATDSRHFSAVTENTYRVLPTVFTGEDLKRLHGDNERIAIKSLVGMARFYYSLIQAM